MGIIRKKEVHIVLLCSAVYLMFALIFVLCIAVFSIPFLVVLGVCLLSGAVMLILGLLLAPFRLRNLLPAALIFVVACALL